MKKALRTYGQYFVAVVILAAIGTACSLYIVLQQRLRTPFQDRYEMRAEFRGSSGLTPGLGQPVNVAGVKVGTISGVELRDGRAVVSMDIDPAELKEVRANAQAILQPVTPGKDLTVELFPGRRPARVISPGGLIPLAETRTPIDSDDLSNVLDRDARDFLDILVTTGGQGVRGRGEDLRRLFKALGPTTKQLEQIGGALADRRRQMRRLVHNLGLVTRAAGAKDRELAQVVDAANATLGALAGEEAALRASIERLPGTLSAARRSLRNIQPFANALGPALGALEPTARRLPATLRSAAPLVAEGVPIVRDRLRPFVRATIPVARELRPTTRDLSRQTPNLTSAFSVLQYVGNEIAHNPPGDNEGFLFWNAWFFHNVASALSTDDAHGAAIRGLAITSCDSVADPTLGPLIEIITGPNPAC